MEKTRYMPSHKTFALLLLLVVGVTLNLHDQVQPDEKPTAIKIYSENPFYWEVNGEPKLLIGGSEEDNLFQIENLVEQLDRIKHFNVERDNVVDGVGCLKSAAAYLNNLIF